MPWREVTPEEHAQAQPLPGQPRELGQPPEHGLGYAAARGGVDAAASFLTMPAALVGAAASHFPGLSNALPVSGEDISSGLSGLHSDVRGALGLNQPSGHPYIEAASSGATSGVPGGPYGMLSGAVGGLASEYTKQQGGGALAQFGAGAGADMATNLAARNLPGIASSAYRAFSPTARAGEMVAPLALGPENADNVTEAILKKYDMAKSAEGRQWDVAQSMPTYRTTSTSSKPLQEAVTEVSQDFNPKDVSNVVDNAFPEGLPQDVTVADVRKLQREVSIAQRAADNPMAAAVNPRVEPQAAAASKLGSAANEMLDNIEAMSADDAQAVSALRSARATSANVASDFSRKSPTYRNVIADSVAPDSAQLAMDKILKSPKADTETDRIINIVGDNETALRGLKRAYIATALGQNEERKVTMGAINYLSKSEAVGRKILGDDGFDHFEKMLTDSYNGQKGGRLGAQIASNVGKGAGAVAGSIVGGPVGAGVGVGAAAWIQAFAKKFGPQAGRQAAIQALYDPEFYAMATAKAGRIAERQIKWADGLASYLLRRGIQIATPTDQPPEQK